MTRQYFYKVTHKYDDENESIFFLSSLDTEDLIKILGCLDFKFEDLVDETRLMSNKSLLKILTTFYEAQPILSKPKKELLNYTRHNKEEVKMVEYFPIPNTMFEIIQIDRFWAREYCCGPNYEELMKEYIPDNEKLIDMIKNSKPA